MGPLPKIPTIFSRSITLFFIPIIIIFSGSGNAEKIQVSGSEKNENRSFAGGNITSENISSEKQNFFLDLKAREKIIQGIREVIGFSPGINHDVISYFSREIAPHPLSKIMLSDALFALLIHLQSGSIIYDLVKSGDFPGIFITIAKYYADVKRINLLSNPAEKYFKKKEKIESESKREEKEQIGRFQELLSGISSCISDIKKSLIFDELYNVKEGLPELTPSDFQGIDDIKTSILLLGGDKIYGFLKNLNTSFLKFILCAEEFRKRLEDFLGESGYKDELTRFSGEIEGTSFYIYGAGDDIIFVPDSYSSVIIDFGGNDLYIMKSWDDSETEISRENGKISVKKDEAGKNLKVVKKKGGTGEERESEGKIEVKTELELDEKTKRSYVDRKGKSGLIQREENREKDDSQILLIIDIGSGNDRYVVSGSRRTFYMNYIYDYGGDDLWRCHFVCAGAGVFGAEMVVDRDGNDKYISRGISQGAGIGGVGILLDLNGNDRYESLTHSQGAGVVGAGVLVDFSGDDEYILLDGNGFPSFQDKNKNLSAGQGCGFGLRADFLEEYNSVPGGLGLLFDFKGNDKYSGQVFSQGCGYWYGIGFLLDSGGDDSYKSYWYCQGSSAHFGIGIMSDLDGSDSYICEKDQGLGHGHDLGVGILFDIKGDDKYTCNTRCLGMGHANGLGLFIDYSGNDYYKAEKNAFGDAITSVYQDKMGIRNIIKTYGIFIDTGGNNSLFLGENKIDRENEISDDNFIFKFFSVNRQIK